MTPAANLPPENADRCVPPGEPPAVPGSLPYAPAPRHGWWQAHALYPQAYTWYVFLSALDLMLTWVILHLGGREVNVLADWVIARFNLPGLVAFKFLLVVLVVILCELVGRRRPGTGRRLARWAVVLSAVPVLVAAAHLLGLLLRGPHNAFPELGPGAGS